MSTGHSGAGEILEDLYRRHLFTHRRPGEVLTYQYHALFQTFLRVRARKMLSANEEKALASRAAQLLEENRLIDDAIMPYREATDWESVGRLIRSEAPTLLRQGRGQTLRDWIGALPMERVEADPWLVYWLGASLIPVNQKTARQRLELAFEKFEADGDLLGQALAASGVIDTYYFEWSEFRSMTRWIRALERVVANAPIPDSRESELQIYSSLIVATLYAEPGHHLLPQCVERVTQMLDMDIDVNHRVRAATCVLSYCSLTGDLERGKSVATKVEPLLAHAELSPLNQIWWRTRLSYLLWNLAEYEAAADLLEQAERIAETHGLDGLRSAKILMLNYRLFVAVATGDFRTGEACLRATEMLPDLSRRMGAWHRTMGRIEFELGRGNTRLAFESGHEAVKVAHDSGMVYIEVVALLAEARGHADHGSHESVMIILDRARELVGHTCLAHLETEILLVEAYSLLRHHGTDRGLPSLANALAHARQTGYSYNLRWNSTMPYLCAEAIRAGIELGYVNEVIRKYRLRPPVHHIEAWPWPVKIFTLGRFEIVLNGEPVNFSGKAPRKPLALLKTLIAFGGRNVPEERLMDALWPEEEADSARKALDITVLRLRKILGSHDAITVGDESLELNPRLCWTDVCAFQDRAEKAEQTTEAAADALRLYRGNFLPGDAEAPWTAKTRERLRSKFVRLTEAVAAYEENAGNWDKAIALYLKGLEADDLVEAFYQGLMRCYRAQGRHAEAMSAYRRLRQLLSVVLGIAPSEATQLLARSLQRENPAQSGSP